MVNQKAILFQLEVFVKGILSSLTSFFYVQKV